MTKSIIPDWVPDWKNAEAYTKSYVNYLMEVEPISKEIISLTINEWPIHVWVWEFLRRNSEYQTDYKQFSELPGYHDHGSKTSKWSGRAFEGDMTMWYFHPPANPGETSEQYFHRNRGIDFDFMPMEAHLMLKWCITNVPDPAKDDGYSILWPEIEMPPYWIQIEGIDESGYIPPMPDADEIHHVTLRFDLRYNLDSQIKKAIEYIKYQKQHLTEVGNEIDLIRATGHQLHKLPFYLRAFDADCTGATPSEIGKILFPEKRHELGLDSMKQSAYTAVKEGKELVAGGFKDLIRFK